MRDVFNEIHVRIFVVIVIPYAIDDFCYRESNKVFGVFRGNCLQDSGFLPH